jgi:uroporphyrinogen decarboxylase
MFRRPQVTNPTNDTPLLLRALRGEDTATAPCWFMRQAGRFLPEYRALKEKHSFWELARTPELAAEVTLQPITRFGMDAAILFQDIMTPLPPMGVDIEFTPGPVIASPIRTAAQVRALRVPAAAEIAPFVPDAIRIIRQRSTTPLIGFGGAPLTLATYLVEGSGSKDYARFRGFLKSEPALAHELVDKLTDVSISYLTSQVQAGAQAIQIFDSWAGLHDIPTWRTFSEPYNRRIFEAISALGVPTIYLAVDSAHLYDAIFDLPADAFSVDWRTPLDRLRGRAGTRCLQGNLDPSWLLAPEEALRDATLRVLRSGCGGAHVFNLGHGMLPFVQPERLQVVIDTVRSFRRHENPAHESNHG